MFPLGPLILSKGIYLLRALSTYYHLFPLSKVKGDTKPKGKWIFILQSHNSSRNISASPAYFSITAQIVLQRLFQIRKMPHSWALHTAMPHPRRNRSSLRLPRIQQAQERLHLPPYEQSVLQTLRASFCKLLSWSILSGNAFLHQEGLQKAHHHSHY